MSARLAFFDPSRWRVKTKLIITALIPLMLLLPMVAGLLYKAGESAYSTVLISKVRSDLVIATQEFDRLQQLKLAQLSAYSESAKFRAQAVEIESATISLDLTPVVQRMELSYLRLIALDGKVKSSYPLLANLPSLTESDLGTLRARESSAQVVLLNADSLSAISPQLAESVRQPILPTHNASPDGRKEETRGMVLLIVVPVFVQGRQLGWLEAGVLLNRNFSIVDKLSNLIYPSGALLEGSRGSATIFLEDVRVATTIQLDDYKRALGTRVSDEVRESVMGRGNVWLERAFVVNNWYIAGYAPISTQDGARIGMLYVGFLEAPYAALKTQLLLLFLIAVGVSMFFGALMVNKLTKVIFKPLGKMNRVMSMQEAGYTQSRVGPMKRQDEISELASHFDDLLDQLAQRQLDLEKINSELDARVSQRTAALDESNRKLREAMEQILATEKLALMGQLTAGVAHEFNNPLAVMMGHLDLLRLELAGRSADTDTLNLLDQQVQRMQKIVQKLLQFCRPEEYVNFTQQVDVARIISDCLLFVGAEVAASGVQIVRDDQAKNSVQISSTELQQILVNLLINACHACEEKPMQAPADWRPFIEIATEDFHLPNGYEGVRIHVRNSGSAISASLQNQVFKMFYTTKREGKGSGVGLPVSKMLIQRYGGDLSVKSPIYGTPPDYGVVFTVTILCQARRMSELLENAHLSLRSN